MPSAFGKIANFWQFSLAFYALPDMAPALLRLQDENGADVNVMLFLLYLARAERALRASEVARIHTVAVPWRVEIVAPVRQVRGRLKTAVGAFEPAASAGLRSQVQRVELAAEKLQQQTLERTFPLEDTGTAGTDPAACARANLALYEACIGPLEEASLRCILERFGASAVAAPRPAPKGRA
jgi:uncharacterized protein (TIGR02444 family)